MNAVIDNANCRWLIRRSGRSPHRTNAGVTVVLLGLIILQCGLMTRAAWQYSPTIDEPGHLVAGLSYWQTGSFGFYKVNPPVARLLAAAPVCLMNPVVDWSRAAPASSEYRTEFSYGRYFIDVNRDRIRELFFAARVACLPFAVLGTLLCYQWSRVLFGDAAALLAAFLWSMSPMVLGHGSLATPDVPAAVVGGLAVFSLRSWLNTPTLRGAAMFGFLAGLAVATKFTWVPVLPLAALVLTLLWHVFGCPGERHVMRVLLHGTVSVLASILTLCAVYDFEGVGTRLKDIELHSSLLGESAPMTEFGDHRNARSAHNRFSGHWIGNLPMPIPVNCLQGIDLQQRDFEPPYRFDSFLCGVWQTPGWWYFYLAAALFKVPLPILILVCCGIVFAANRILRTALTYFRSPGKRPLPIAADGGPVTGSHGSDGFANYRELSVLLCLPLLLLTLLSLKTGFTIHFRYALPALPYLIVLASSVLRGRASMSRRIVVLLLSGWLTFSVLAATPNWISYFNELAGGSDEGYRCLTDSNVDWGQGMWELRDWWLTHGDGAPIWFVGHRVSSPDNFAIPWRPAPPFVPGHADVVSETGQRGPQAGWHVISRWALVGGKTAVVDENGTHISAYAYYERFPLVTHIGNSLNVYHLTEAEAAQALHELLVTERPQPRATASGD